MANRDNEVRAQLRTMFTVAERRGKFLIEGKARDMLHTLGLRLPQPLWREVRDEFPRHAKRASLLRPNAVKAREVRRETPPARPDVEGSQERIEKVVFHNEAMLLMLLERVDNLLKEWRS